jgi:hypothetical protein
MLGLLEQLVAHAGKPVVAVTEDLVKVAQKGDAVALFALMYDAQAFDEGLAQPRTAGRRARRT